MNFLPVSINIENKKILIIGGGKVAVHKARLLSRFTSEATVVAPELHEGFGELPFTVRQKRYEPADLNGAFLVYICTENEALNAAVKAECERFGILASVCDNPALCDFISPAIFKQDNVTVAVSSNGTNVRQSIALRDRIAEWLKGAGMENAKNILQR